MRRRWMLAACVVAVVGLGLAGWSAIGAENPAPRLLTGEMWTTLSPDAKVAFVWGVGNLVEFERARNEVAATDGKSFIPFLVRGLRGKPINEVVGAVDAWYGANPGEAKRPVVDAIFQAVVLPALNAGRQGGGKR